MHEMNVVRGYQVQPLSGLGEESDSCITPNVKIHVGWRHSC